MTQAARDLRGESRPPDWSRVSRVLLVRLRSIGDTVLMTPCLQALKDWQPGVEIGVVTEPAAAPVLEGHPLVDHLLVVGKSPASRLRVLSRIVREHFDLAFNLHGGTTAMMLTAMSGARHTVGYRGRRGSWLLSSRAPGPDVILGRTRIHSVEQQLALLRWTGVPMPAQPRLSLTIDPGAVSSLRTKLIGAGISDTALNSRRFAIVVPGATFDSKRWSSPGFGAVMDHLSSRWQLESIVIAGPGQERLAAEVAAASNTNARVLSSIGVAELKALFETFGRVFVGNDGGPMHIAAALNCPVAAVFGSSNPDVWHPWTDAAHRVVGGERGAGDSDARDAINRIAVADVIAAVDQVLESAATQAPS